MASKIFDEYAPSHPMVVLDKQNAVGGKGGYLFDSGCNLSTLQRVHIQSGDFEWNSKTYPCTIKRIFFDFEKPLESSQSKSQPKESLTPFYRGLGVSGEYTETIFEMDANDSIVRIDVWTSEDLVNAVQFHMKSGLVSELYGAPYIDGPLLTTFEGKSPASKLVGVHGSFGGVMNKLGFTFATGTVFDDDIGFPPLTEESTDVTTKEDDDDSSWTMDMKNSGSPPFPNFFNREE